MYGSPKVTMISDLPELADVEMKNRSQYPQRPPSQGPRASYQDQLPPEMADKYKNIIRNHHVPDPSSGMNPYSQPMQQQNESISPPIRENLQEDDPSLSIPCISIARHINNCPICSKFYRNDKTVYIIIIAVLVIISLLLLKKVLDLR